LANPLKNKRESIPERGGGSNLKKASGGVRRSELTQIRGMVVIWDSRH